MNSAHPQPFQFVNGEPDSVKNKYLEGIPNANNFPGPFQGQTQEQMRNYKISQSAALRNWGQQAVESPQVLRYTANSGNPNCSSLGGRQEMFPPVQPGLQPGPQNSPGIQYSNNINRSTGGPTNDYRRENFKGVDDFYDGSITNPQSQTGFGTIVPSFAEMPQGAAQQIGVTKCSAEGNPLLDIDNRPIEQFSHNNMVPYYGSKLTQNMSVTGQAQAGDNNSCKGVTNGFANVTPYRGTLENQTGTDEMWMHKRESAPMYSPVEQQTGWVFGAPAIRPDMDRYKTQVWKRHGEKPVESVQVGPGIGIDYSTPAVGGFQQFTRILPNNVTDKDANQLEGRVVGGKWAIDHPTSQFIEGVTKNLPDLEITQARRPTQPGKFATNAPSAGVSGMTSYLPSVMKGRQARSQTEQSGGFGQLNLTEYGYDADGKLSKKENFSQPGGMPCVDYSSAPIGMTMKSHVPRGSQDRASYNNIRETFKKGAGGYSEKTGYWECGDATQGQEQWGINLGGAKGVVNAGENRDGKYINYTDRGEVNPFVINATGTATQSGGLWNPNSYSQPARVTTKETNSYSYAGNASGATNNSYTNTWADAPKVTTKETTDYSHVGAAAQGGSGFYKNQWDSDAPRVTRKETVAYAHSGNAAKAGTASMNRSMFTGGDTF
jgi:hypothetical protein